MFVSQMFVFFLMGFLCEFIWFHVFLKFYDCLKIVRIVV